MTVEELAELNIPETEDYELVDGELVPLASGSLLHSLIQGKLLYLLANYFDVYPPSAAVTSLHCQLGERLVRRPDVAVFLGDQWRQIDRYRTPAALTPDIAVEVVSPSEHILDVTRKVREYLEAGAKEVWFVDEANGEVQVRTTGSIRLLEAGDTLSTPLLPRPGGRGLDSQLRLRTCSPASDIDIRPNNAIPSNLERAAR